MQPFKLQGTDHIDNIRSALKIKNFADIYQLSDNITVEKDNNLITLSLSKVHDKDFFQLSTKEGEVAAFYVQGEGAEASFEFNDNISFDKVTSVMQNLSEVIVKKPQSQSIDLAM
jgi:hypothetical protein